MVFFLVTVVETSNLTEIASRYELALTFKSHVYAPLKLEPLEYLQAATFMYSIIILFVLNIHGGVVALALTSRQRVSSLRFLHRTILRLCLFSVFYENYFYSRLVPLARIWQNLPHVSLTDAQFKYDRNTRRICMELQEQ
jgi:hypothetical protein